MVFSKPTLAEKILRAAGRAAIGTAKWVWEGITSIELLPSEETEAPDDPNEPDYVPPRGWDGEYEYNPPRGITKPDPDDPEPPPPAGEDTDVPPSPDQPFLPFPPIRITPFIFAPDIDININPRQPKPQLPIVNPPLIIPSLPTRRLPKPNINFNTQPTVLLEDRLISVKQDSMTRTYACLLHSPVTASPVPYRLCKIEENENEEDIAERLIEDFREFLIYLLNKIRESTFTISKFKLCIAAVMLLPATKFLKYLPFGTGTFVTAVGCNTLIEIAETFSTSSKNFDYDQVDGQAHTNIKYIECKPEKEDQPQEDPLEYFELGNDCDVEADGFIPVRNFRTNEPQQLGMKRQLEVIYEGEGNVDERDPITFESTGNVTKIDKLQKVINIPSIKGDITTQLIKDTFPDELHFGMVKVETDVTPYGHIRFYSREIDVENGNTDNLLDDIIDNLIEGDEVKLSRRYSKRVRDQTYGKLTLKTAKLYEWDKTTGLEPFVTRFTLT